ncbi:DUF1385 domain-containing protein [Halonatronum saccharophilum]|uniref:DUF1385 domain-containing protein n=1 Tax=Halonatronum saccharophilum TaxID=150060 RepID=UPI0004865A42|nr:DUF1385 domain-containing protein [Halonatronum saccharophilum]
MAKKSYGGQAVIEGVMMKGKDKIAIAVRNDQGDIILENRTLNNLADKFKFLKWPMLRGVFALFQSLIIGMQALTFSANQFGEEEEELSTKEIIFTILTSFSIAIAFFVILPATIIRLIQEFIEYDLVLNFIEGLIKITFFISYIYVISRFEDIKRVFQYHGAEHKVIHNYESDLPLSIENAGQFSTLHPRCGTNFLLLVMITSILLFSFFGRPTLLNRILIHITLLPVVAGLSYEIIKKAGKDKVNKIFKLIALPGLYLQKLTTSEPTPDQLEVAIVSLEAVLEEEGTYLVMDND